MASQPHSSSYASQGQTSSSFPAISHPYPPSYSSPRPLQPTQFQSPSPDPYASTASHPLYPGQSEFHRTRSNSSSSLQPVFPMGFQDNPEKGHVEKEKISRTWYGARKRETDAGGHDAFPPGWNDEDREAEKKFIEEGMFDWRSMKNWRFWIRLEWWYWYLGAIILGVLVALMALFHDDIVDWLTPVANWMKDLPAGYTIPAAVIFVLSFPPLFGQEIVAVLCGVVWGLWVGFAIVAVGTFLGEVGNFYAFKYWCRSRAEKYENNNLNYAIMAHVVRDGGFFFIFTVRLSAIPGHFSTAVFATCGMGIIIFSIACILTLPKQLIVVYLGVLFNEKEKSTKSKIISYVVLIVGFIITIWAVWYCYREMNKVKLIVWRRQRAKSKGIIVDPLTGEYSRSTILNKEAQEELDDMRSPILKDQDRPASYQNPYDIRYQQSTDDMSVYQVDAVQKPYERDIAYNNPYHHASPSEILPTARPAQPTSVSGLQRSTTSASALGTNDPTQIVRTTFPIPAPAGGPPGHSGYGNPL